MAVDKSDYLITAVLCKLPTVIDSDCDRSKCCRIFDLRDLLLIESHLFFSSSPPVFYFSFLCVVLI